MSEINEDYDTATESTSIYSMVATFRVSSTHPLVVDGRDVQGLVQELEDVTELLDNEHVTVRGWYDVSGLHHDADLLVWLHGDTAEGLQWGLRELRRSNLLSPLIRVSSSLGVHADGEAPLALDEQPYQWIAVAQRAPLDLAIFEADEVADLASPTAELPVAPRIGRFIELVEIIEVLQ
ncbi:chlorite dismutase [Leucobacter exalbidus]|uniref:hydrogen peroxide-dependent heme synthase n=1 Tax=Leucobacter exalbidus TaxID=662960 RepID=A0A940PVG0_9MICO|nr:chlorite dismutase family protein [Leucobacter exalbidus]MBP1326960.1 chlorite dismutase [Leucobacter exalbidus]